MSCEENFLKQLHQRGFRLTPQRELVLLVLHQIGRAASAVEIKAMVSTRNAGVELSTVYRTLDLLNSLSLVAVIDTGEKQRLFELAHASPPHLHLVCRACGKITGLDLVQLQPLLEQIRSAFNFQADLSNTAFSGICGDCSTQPA